MCETEKPVEQLSEYTGQKLSALERKQPVTVPSRCGYSGTPQADLENKGEEHYFSEKKEGVGRGCSEQSLLRGSESSGRWWLLTV